MPHKRKEALVSPDRRGHKSERRQLTSLLVQRDSSSALNLRAARELIAKSINVLMPQLVNLLKETTADGNVWLH